MPGLPLVSTIIPTHNRASLLPAAIESALAQDIADHEIIVVDDHSQDDTPQVAARYPVRYLRIEGGKPSRTRNAGLREARGRYLSFLDDDDVWLPGRLTSALELLEADGDLGMVYGQVQPVDLALNPIGPPFPPLPLAEGHPVGAFLDVVVHLNAATIRRSVLEEIGLFDDSVYGAEDMDLTVRIARHYRCAAIPRPLALVRFHRSFSNSSTKLWERWQDESQLLARHLRIADEYQMDFRGRQRLFFKRRGWYTHMFLNEARRAAEQRDFREARLSWRYAWMISPLHSIKSPLFWRAALRLRA